MTKYKTVGPGMLDDFIKASFLHIFSSHAMNSVLVCWTHKFCMQIAFLLGFVL